MAKLVKEDEKNERIIRGLLKLPENRRCINCNSLGPQYVCTNFWIFVCTTCSGIHREFTHQVKSISMANFSAHEVSDLEGGGNERAKEFYFKEWDPQRQSVPARSDIERLRDFIKHVYVDRRYTGESSNYKPSRTMTVEWEDSYTNRSGFGSPFYDNTHEWHYSERSMSGGRNDETYSRYNYDERSPVYDQDNERYPECRRSISSFQVVDHRSCDRSGSRKHEGNRSSNGEPANLEGRSLDHEKDTSIPPVMHSVQDIWEQFPTLRIGIHSKAISDGASDDAAQMQRTASSSSIESIDGNVVEIKREDSRSLINFNANPKPAQQNQGTSSSAGQSMIKLTNSFTDNNWVAFDSFNKEKICQDASDGKIMGSKWSVPAAAPVINMSMFPVTGNVCTEHIHNIRALPIDGASATASILPRGGSASVPAVASSGKSLLPIGGGDSFRKTNDTRQWPSMEQHHNSKFPNTASLSIAEKFVPSISVGSKNSMIANLNGLQDHFTATYSSIPVPIPGWYAVQPQHQVPAMTSSQGDELNMLAPRTVPSLLRASSLVSPYPQWMPPQSTLYATSISHQPSAYSGQQKSTGLPLLEHERVGHLGSDGSVSDSLNTNNRLGGRLSVPATPHSFSSIEGNHFG